MRRYTATWKGADGLVVAVLLIAANSPAAAFLIAASADTPEFRDHLGIKGPMEVDQLPPPQTTPRILREFAERIKTDPLGGFTEVDPPKSEGGDN